MGKREGRPIQLSVTGVVDGDASDWRGQSQHIVFTFRNARWTELGQLTVSDALMWPGWPTTEAWPRSITKACMREAWLALRNCWRSERARQKRCRVRNAAYAAECDKRSVAWDAGFRPPLTPPGPGSTPSVVIGQRVAAVIARNAGLRLDAAPGGAMVLTTDLQTDL